MLNKIDVLWDDLAGETFCAKRHPHHSDQHCQTLGIRPEDVLPLSAKQAMLAKVRKDADLLTRSQISNLENLLCEHHRAERAPARRPCGLPGNGPAAEQPNTCSACAWRRSTSSRPC